MPCSDHKENGLAVNWTEVVECADHHTMDPRCCMGRPEAQALACMSAEDEGSDAINSHMMAIPCTLTSCAEISHVGVN